MLRLLRAAGRAGPAAAGAPGLSSGRGSWGPGGGRLCRPRSRPGSSDPAGVLAGLAAGRAACAAQASAARRGPRRTAGRRRATSGGPPAGIRPPLPRLRPPAVPAGRGRRSLGSPADSDRRTGCSPGSCLGFLFSDPRLNLLVLFPNTPCSRSRGSPLVRALGAYLGPTRSRRTGRRSGRRPGLRARRPLWVPLRKPRRR